MRIFSSLFIININGNTDTSVKGLYYRQTDKSVGLHFLIRQSMAACFLAQYLRKHIQRPEGIMKKLFNHNKALLLEPFSVKGKPEFLPDSPQQFKLSNQHATSALFYKNCSTNL